MKSKKKIEKMVLTLKELVTWAKEGKKEEIEGEE